jgi:predicted nuclease with TOPRIM domain
MSTEELLKKMTDQKALLDSLNDKLNSLYTEQRKLEEEYGKFKMEYLFQSDILKESPWDINRCGKNFTLHSYTNKFKKLSAIFESDYHCHIDLSKEETLRFDDGEISLHFKSIKKAFEFIKKYDLPLNMEPLIKERDFLKEAFNTLDGTLKKIKKGTGK